MAGPLRPHQQNEPAQLGLVKLKCEERQDTQDERVMGGEEGDLGAPVSGDQVEQEGQTEPLMLGSQPVSFTPELDREVMMVQPSHGMDAPSSGLIAIQEPRSLRRKRPRIAAAPNEPTVNEPQPQRGGVIRMEFDLEKIRARQRAAHRGIRGDQEQEQTAQFGASSLSTEGFNDAQAQDELRRIFEKQSFKEMRVVGQFNKGFIVCRLHDEIFIVDQHASDEKYNYETLRHKTQIKIQKLIAPLKMDLTAVQVHKPYIMWLERLMLCCCSR